VKSAQLYLSLEQSQTSLDEGTVVMGTDVVMVGLGREVIGTEVYVGIFIGVFSDVGTVEEVVMDVVVDGEGAIHPDTRSRKITEKQKLSEFS